MLGIKDNKTALLETTKIQKTPLYYMGGKTKAIKQLLSFVPMNVEEVMSPFIGGGSFEVALASLGINVLGFDLYYPLYCFWHSLLSRQDQLIQEVELLKPVTRESYKQLLALVGSDAFAYDEDSMVIMGAAYFALNRSSFMAQIWAGISTNPKNNITDRLIERLRKFNPENLNVYYGDFNESLGMYSANISGQNFLVYLDPPYYVAKGTNYYGKKGNLGNFDHEALLGRIKNLKTPWILSYDNVPEVREMYKEYRQIPLQWVYSNATGSYTPDEPKEILIISNDLPDVVEV